MVLHACNLSPGKMKVGELEAQGHPELKKFEVAWATGGPIAAPSPSKNKEN